ncbi:uroporphyrinogen-III C-methyltransferase [Waterburya agarophytonicola K14]|uniref:uroporphyrinogen-III C-methyltransferase n=1 Tax=Waterburya agarophytonicola KI4 TaxID=2874699 RepID=A0A964FGB6_9CYAN|nr:uroporphyrinogen-III C-methyltransferase [Waterburya agarophytonicola]MCC0178675.1 uroporphyrinogen-III C-methyltransferase [Waterburya agarophytonicola KI4]
MSAKGKVYLVGAGVGTEAYLTVRGKQLLNIAQVLIYDALVDRELLDLVREDCLKICVGKRGGKASTPQENINQLLVAYCLQGKQVVRLKSGDPFIFGRANEEIAVLQASKCNFELIPGISSALAAPLLAGIPLTDKDLSRCFAVLSGHQPEKLDWSALASIDTLVILMGGRSLKIVVENLIHYKRSPNEPIVIIRNCGQSDRQIFRGTLTDIVEITRGISLSPAVIVIGKVVQLSPDPQTPSSIQPLTKKTILVTRAQSQSSKFTTLLEQQGATVVEMPALAITPPSSWTDLDSAIANLAEFDWLILTSANGVDYFCDRLDTLGYDGRALAGVKIAVVGRKTASVLQKRRLKPDFIPPDYIADSLVANFPEDLPGQKILFPRVESGGREVLVQELSAKGAEVIEVAAYQSQCPQQIDRFAWQVLQQKQIDIVTFASSKTVKNFYQLLEQQLLSMDGIDALLKDVCIASIGPQTSKTCQELLGRFDIEAEEYTLEGLTTALVNLNRSDLIN